MEKVFKSFSPKEKEKLVANANNVVELLAHVGGMP